MPIYYIQQINVCNNKYMNGGFDSYQLHIIIVAELSPKVYAFQVICAERKIT